MRRTALLPSKDMDRRDYELIKKLDLMGAQAQAGFRQIDLGYAPSGGGSASSITDHGQLSGLADDDHLQYALLAGRVGGQWLRGSPSTNIATSIADSAPFMSTQNKAGGSSWSGAAIGTGAAVGTLVVVGLTTDNFADDTGNTNHHTSMSDTKSNTWTKQYEYTAAFFSGTRGVTVSVWTTVVTTAMVAGTDTITFNFDAAVTARAAQGHTFVGLQGYAVKRVGAATTNVQNATSGTGTGTATLSNLRNGQYLYIRITGVEDNNLTFTPDTAYTLMGNEQLSVTNGGVLSSNIGCFGEFLISTGTGTTTNPTINYSNVPNTGSVLVALAVAPPASGLLLLQSIGSVIAATLELRDEQATMSPLLVDQSVADDDRVTLKVRASSSQTSRLTQWANSSDTEMSYIRVSDGAFVGPLVASGTDTHPDDIFQILGSADATKKVMFEVDGLTTATTRTLTVPDVSATLILSQGTSAGQVIGTNSHTGGSASSLVVEGKVMLGEALAGVNFTTNQVLYVSASPTTLGTGTNTFARIGLSLTGVTTVNSTANLRGLQIDLSGTINASSGTIGTLAGFFMTGAVTIPTGVTVTTLWAGQFTSSANTSGGTITNNGGFLLTCNGDLSSTAGTAFTGIEISMSPRNQSFSSAYGLRITRSATNTGTITDFRAFSVENNVATTATTWYGLKIPLVSGPSTQWGLYIEATKNAISGLTSFGTASTPANYVDIGAGSTTIAPLKFTSGAVLTSPVAGAVEFLTDDLYLTISTGTARKSFVLTDGTNLTAGRVPFATTNGRLTDDADFTFSVDTLTITKIAATQFVGDVQFTGSGVGFPYGSCYGNEIAWSQASAGAGTFYEVSDTDMTDGELNNVTHDGSGKLTVTIAGRYLITYSVCLEADAANIHLVSAISVNGTEISPGRMHFHRASASEATPLAGTAVVNLAANDTVEVAVATADAGSPTLTVDHLNISVVQVGG